MPRAFVLVVIMLVCTSCSGLGFLFGANRNPFDLDEYQKIRSDDYAAHLVGLGAQYLQSGAIKVVPIEQQHVAYLERIHESILSNNELLLTKKSRPKFHFIQDPAPFHFSLPNAQYFLSTGLVLKYLKSEDLLVAVIAFEAIKSSKEIYEKKIVVPTGHVTTERLLSMTRVDLDTKNELNKWSFYVMKRAGHDGFAYLNWLQIQNKNLLDFSLLNYEVRDISKEEYAFKGFMVQEGKVWRDDRVFDENSSTEYYRFIQSLKRQGT